MLRDPANIDSYAAIEFRLDWVSPWGAHSDRYFGQQVNFWRDLFPPGFREPLLSAREGDRFSQTYEPGDAIPDYDARRIFAVPERKFAPPGLDVRPRTGRFYPKGMLKDVANVYRANVAPFRCVGREGDRLRVDFNPPMAGRKLTVSAEVSRVWEKFSDTGGGLTHWLEAASEGPGMQVRWDGVPTDFFSGRPFEREDERPDGDFYAAPRFVQHIDATAIEGVSRIYEDWLPPGGRVLDLMSSWVSHLPESLAPSAVFGLGLNEAELAANPALTDRRVQDLNRDPRLPYETAGFDGVACTVSAEYLTDPFAVFREVARVLRPGGVFAVTFSNRWFPPKAIRIWKEIHEFERMGLVMEYFLESGAFHDLETRSIRGLPRPEDDRHFPNLFLSDPVYAVKGVRGAEPAPSIGSNVI
ncbi:MAG: methyltransferase domain-containing protein [Desulfococcaceae bacterium]